MSRVHPGTSGWWRNLIAPTLADLLERMQDSLKLDITGVILAGGKARRMGGEDKGLLLLSGKPLIQHVLERLGPQVDHLAINANRNHERYAAFGVPVFGDTLGEYQGPLAGMAAALEQAETPLVVLVPCDSPLIPVELVQRLHHAMQQQQSEIAVAHDGRRMQPVWTLLRRDLLPSLQQTLAGGERKVDRWYAMHRTALADLSDCPDAFTNANTPEELAAMELRLKQSQ